MIKVLHCADLHLDSPFSYEDPEKSEIRRNELRGTFTSLMMYAKMNAVDVMLIAGDLFDMKFVTKDTVSLVLREFAKNPSCRFVISPGNHDPYTENSVYNKVDFPDNVYIFRDETISRFSFDDINTDVYGYAFTSSELVSPIPNFHVPESMTRLNLLCAHADIYNPLSPQCYTSEKDLDGTGFDYIALGHIHNSQGIAKLPGGGYFGYSGCLEGRDYGECGYKGAYIAELEKQSGTLTANIRGQKFSKRRYECEKLDVTGAKDMYGIVSAAKKLASDKKYGEDTSLKIIFSGAVSPELNISEKQLKEELPLLFNLDIKDCTVPLFDYEKLKDDLTIKGAFFSELEDIIRNGTPEERETASKALKYGLAALSGAELNGI